MIRFWMLDGVPFSRRFYSNEIWSKSDIETNAHPLECIQTRWYQEMRLEIVATRFGGIWAISTEKNLKN